MFPTDLNPDEQQPRRDPSRSHEPRGDAASSSGHTPAGPWASRFEELSVELAGETVAFTRIRSNTTAQHAALFGSAVAFAVFVAAVMPLMQLTAVGKAIWIIVGILVMAVIGLVMHARIETTRLQLNREGLTIDQGTELDHESIVVLWAELSGCDLEPVSETDGRKGMQLRLRPRTGEPIDVLGGVALGELNDVRRVILETLNRHRQQPGRRA